MKVENEQQLIKQQSEIRNQKSETRNQKPEIRSQKIMEQNLISGNINIADRIYRIQMSADDEQTVRQSVKIINDKIVEFKTKIPGKDMQDYISMVLVWFVTESNQKNVSLADEKHLLGKLQQIESLIDAELK